MWDTQWPWSIGRKGWGIGGEIKLEGEFRVDHGSLFF